MIDDKEDGSYICGYNECYTEIEPDKMQEGKDFGVIVFRNGAEWMVKPSRVLPIRFTNPYEDESPEFPVESIAYLLCKNHFVSLRAEIIANRGIGDGDLRKIMEGTR